MSRVVIVGSSPQLLVEAIRRAESGANVVVCEAGRELGGAWTTTSFAGYRRVEVACHLLERDEKGYDILRGLGVDLAPMSPQPRTVIGRMDRSYTAPMTAAAQLAYYPVARARRRHSLDRAGWRRRRRLAVRELVDAVADRSPVLGLTGGAGQLIEALAARCVELGVEIRPTTPVERIECSADGVSVIVPDGPERADLVVISAAFAPDRLFVDSVASSKPRRQRTYVHRLLAMPRGSVTPHSYIRFPHDPVLQRCSLVTHAAIAESDAAVADLLLVSVRCDDAGAPLHDLDTTLARLAERGLIGDARPSDERILVYVGSDAEPALRAAADGRNDIRVLDSFGDLTRALAAGVPTAPSAPLPVR